MKPRATNPPAAGSTETAANKINLDTLDFDAVTTEYAQFVYAMPKSWNEAAVTVQFIWTADGSGTAVWGVQAVSFNHGNAIDAAFGAAQTVTETGGAGVIAYSAFTAPVTPGGDPASDFSALIFQVYRAGGTLASDAKLIGIRLNFVTEAQTDA
jgi:hypothetical protein